ncbi:MAG: CbiM family transporter [Bacillota bacterium]|nr:CbiM family transporter [Bacillota bacterium]
MHLADGVLSPTMVALTYVATAASIGYELKKTDSEDIPKVALMAGTFFAASLISIPIPPSSVHPLLCGLIGIILGGKSVLAFFPALFLQALLFRHGGLTTLGANTVLLFIPAVISSWIYRKIKLNPLVKGTIVGALSVVMTVIILVVILMLTDKRFAAGDFSVVKILVLTHFPLVIAEGLITGAAARFLEKTKTDWIYKGE